jgi:hypothetical protein
MVASFQARLVNSLAHLALPPRMVRQLEANATKLAGLQVPAEVDDHTKAAIREAIKEAFVFGFRIVMLMCTGLSLVSAGIAWVMIQKNREEIPHQP